MKRCLIASLAITLLAACSEEPVSDANSTYHLHRLNQAEYNNTVRDLLGTTLRPADHFPQDDVSHGFDNIASVLSLSPVQVEMYHRAAEQLIADALVQERTPAQVIELEDLQGKAVAEVTGTAPVQPLDQYAEDESEDSLGRTYRVGARTPHAWKFVSESSLRLPIPAPGTYRVTIRAWVERAGPTPVRMNVELGGTTVKAFDVLAEADKPEQYQADVTFDGTQPFALRYTNDFDTGSRWRNLLVDSVTLEGPIGETEPNPLRARIVTCEPDLAQPAVCGRKIIGKFATRAWRRPIRDEELTSLEALAGPATVEDQAAFEAAINLALTAVLTSPHFVFRVETQPRSGKPAPLSPYELASRLAYFLWSSMPDARLFEAAANDALGTQAELEAQIERMLADPKSAAFVDNFVGQWLTLRGLAAHEPNRKTYPDYDLSLKADMIGETKQLFAALLAGNRPAAELLTANYTFTTPRLAEHYDLTPLATSASGGFVRATLPATRLGLLGHASVLTATSHPNRTSPVKRGKWVLEQLLCSAPPPPPPAVEGLPNGEQVSASLRERMEQHRTDPVCAGCHKIMDPIGFGLEHYDGTGKWRDLDGRHAINATGALPDGRTFDGGVELARLIATDPRYPQCVTRQMMTYALGREPDLLVVNQLAARWSANGAGLRDLVSIIATSEVFRNHAPQVKAMNAL